MSKCDNCSYRKAVAIMVDLHWMGEDDCPYQPCPMEDPCETCRWGPPTSCDGRPCCNCDPRDPQRSSYDRREDDG